MANVSSRVSDALLAQARASLRVCRLCPRDCGVDRTIGKNGAFCRLGAEASVYRELISVGEEPVISPTWLIDLGGCSLRCLFCSEWTHVTQPQTSPARTLNPAWFVPQLRKRKQQGARTVSFAGGDPTVSLVAVLEVLAQVPDDDWLPVVWNCNGWLSESARALLAPVVSTWLVDVKFGHPDCAQRLAGVDGALNAREVTETLAFARHRGLLLRHLAMPGHLACCTAPILRDLRANYPEIPLNVMSHYLPLGPARSGRLASAPELMRLLTEAETVSLVSLTATQAEAK
jgi:putative pyruvate formate lyase activating enzyme